MTRRKSLTPAQVKAIRSDYKEGVRGHGYFSVARRHGVPEGTVRECVNFKTYYQTEYLNKQEIRK